MRSFQESLEAYATSGEVGDLPDFPGFIQGLEAHFAGWSAGLEQMPEELREQLSEVEQRISQGYLSCLQGAEQLSQTPDPKVAEAFLSLHRQHTQNLYLFQEEVWRLQGPTPLPGINQIFWSYEAWMEGGSQDYYWHCIEAERKRLRYAADTPGMEVELSACAQSLLDALEQLLRLGGGPESELQLDEIQRLAHRYAELLGPAISPNWLAHLELLLDSQDESELHAFVWRKLAELHTLDQGVTALVGQTDSALLEEKGKELQELFQELTGALQDLLENPDTPLDTIREIDEDLSHARQDVLGLVDAQGQLACPKCATTVEKGQKFCPACGFRMLERLEEHQHPELSEAGGEAQVNPNLAYLSGLSQDYVDGKLERAAMEAEVERWHKLLAAVPGDPRLQAQLEQLAASVERLQAWLDAPGLASLSSILEEMEQALREVAEAEAK